MRVRVSSEDVVGASFRSEVYLQGVGLRVRVSFGGVYL